MDTSTILVVDDQPALRESIAEILKASGYHVVTAGDGVEALAQLQQMTVDLILTDIAMPRMNGYQLYEEVRKNPDWIAIPFVLVTARSMDSDIRYGKELGVDDYLVKPIDLEDLLATVRGRLRRAQELVRHQNTHRHTESTQHIGALTIHRQHHEVHVDGQPITLSVREYDLLTHLASAPGRPFSAQELVQITHGFAANPIEASNLIRPLVRTLRRKLTLPKRPHSLIETIRGIGYRLYDPDPKP